MASQVEICNLALAHTFESHVIQSLDEQTRQAEICQLHYAPTLNTLLSIHPWGFATVRAEAQDLDDPPDGWEYRYAYPVHCLRLLEIWPDARAVRTDQKIEYDTMFDPDENKRVILCDQADAYLVYIADNVPTGLYIPTFVECLSWALASKIVLSLTGKPDTAQYLWQVYERTLTQARAADLAERWLKQPTGRLQASRQ